MVRHMLLFSDARIAPEGVNLAVEKLVIASSWEWFSCILLPVGPVLLEVTLCGGS